MRSYRYGFNGKENDNEVKGEGNQQDYGMRVYDPRLGKFLSVDPITAKYPELTPYQFASNRPIDGIDLDGLEYFRAPLINQAGFAKTINTAVDAQEIGAKNPRMGATVVIGKAIYKNYKDGIHGGLDLIGMIPVFGEVPDLLNSALYTAEGNFGNAAFSMAAAIPFFGIAATGVKWSKNAMKLSDNAFHLSSGLILRQGSTHGNRFSHFLAHFANDLKKSYHGVFQLKAKETVVEFLDEAWTLAKAGGSKVAKSVDPVNGRTIYIVDMGRAVGYEGGKKGSGAVLDKVQIVIEKNTKSDLVTAFPVK